MYRRIGFIGDIHCEDVLLEAALDLLAARGVEVVAAAGDLADGPGSLERCCELITSRSVLTVKGNHDRWLLEGFGRDLPEATPLEAVTPACRRVLAGLPRVAELATVSGRALLCHGLGANDMAKVGPEDYGYALRANDDLQRLRESMRYRWILNAHIDRPMVREFEGLTIINGGTLARDREPCCLELDFLGLVARIFRFDPQGQVMPEVEEVPLRTQAR
jgi:predicted phosphodiesterase